MRLIRSVYRPANACLSRRFERFRDPKISAAHLHPVSNRISNLVYASNRLGNDRLYAASASASSASSSLQKRKPNRVSKNERRAMVENYVNKYREANGDKFPSASDIKKDVGGNYYIVRQILQEMIYNSKQSSMDSKDTSSKKSPTKKNEMTYNFKDSEDIRGVKSQIKNNEMACDFEEQSTRISGTSLEKSTVTEFEEFPQTRPILKDVENSSSTIVQSKQAQQSSLSIETDDRKDVGASSHHPTESSRTPDYEKDVKLEDRIKSNASEPSRRSREGPSLDAEARKNSSVWNNLKSFANGILSIWKRS